jgi:ParB-like chromosome segregation protein Spo0J
MEFTEKTVPLDSIDMQDKAFVATAGRPVQDLKNSIGRIGLVNPPWLVFSESKGCFQVVSGYRRVKALGGLGWDRVPAKVFDPQTEAKKLLVFSFYDNLPHRALNPIEKAGVVERLLKYFPEEQIIETYLPLLGMSPCARTFKETVALMQIEDEIKQAVLQGMITEKNALRLSSMQADDRRYLFRLFGRLNLSSSKQAEMLESCCDIAGKDNQLVRDILGNDEIEKILNQDRLTLSQKGDRIRQRLRKKRFPRLARCEQRFADLKKKLNFPPGIELHPPPFFEGGAYCLQIAFHTAEDLTEAAEQVKSTAQSPALRQLLEGR